LQQQVKAFDRSHVVDVGSRGTALLSGFYSFCNLQTCQVNNACLQKLEISARCSSNHQTRETATGTPLLELNLQLCTIVYQNNAKTGHCSYTHINKLVLLVANRSSAKFLRAKLDLNVTQQIERV